MNSTKSTSFLVLFGIVSLVLALSLFTLGFAPKSYLAPPPTRTPTPTVAPTPAPVPEHYIIPSAPVMVLATTDGLAPAAVPGTGYGVSLRPINGFQTNYFNIENGIIVGQLLSVNVENSISGNYEIHATTSTFNYLTGSTDTHIMLYWTAAGWQVIDLGRLGDDWQIVP